ncbi:MAG: N-formylglutamate amidohydrolase [Mesorhizobium sp.]
MLVNESPAGIDSPFDDASANDEQLCLRVEPDDWWTVHRGSSPILATAIHNGHAVRAGVEALMAISADDRMREEDPFTEFVTRDVPNRIAVHRSRFEIDLNRPRDAAVYLSPEQAWGLDIWQQDPPADGIERSLEVHDEYYAMLRQVLRGIQKSHGRFVVLDVHSYNHRRDGPGSAVSDPSGAPEINIGTFSMDRKRWSHVVDPFMNALEAFEFDGHHVDVRENIAFEGRGEQTRFIHDTFPETGCAIAVEFKKFFMDEWTGSPDRKALMAMRAMLRSTLPVLETSLRSQ